MTDQNKEDKASPTSPKGISQFSDAASIMAATANKEKKIFKSLLDTLSKFELKRKRNVSLEEAFTEYENNAQEQTQLLSLYLRHKVFENSEEEIKQYTHFEMIERVINLSPLLELAKVCSNTELLKRITSIISTEKSKSQEDLLRECMTQDGNNILHCLAELIATKYDYPLFVINKDREAFDYFSKLVPELKEQKNKAGFTPVTVLEHAIRRYPFMKLTDALSHLELGYTLEGSEFGVEFTENDDVSQKQNKLLDVYLEKMKGEKDHFKQLDLALATRHLQKTPLDDNEGAAFFVFIRSCSDKTALEKLFERISIEKNKSIKDLLRNYRDQYGFNILHCLSDIAVKKYSSGLQINWNAFNYFNDLSLEEGKPALTEEENKFGYTPEDISDNFIGIKPDETPLYIPPGLMQFRK